MRAQQRRKAWAIALALSLAVHAGLLMVLVNDWTVGAPAMRDDTVTLSLERPLEPEREKLKPADKPPAPPAPRQAIARPVDSPVAPLITAAPAETPGAALAGTGRAESGAPATEEAQGPVLRVPCLSQDLARMSPLRRRECENFLADSSAGYRGLPRGALDGPNLSGALQSEFKAAFDKRRENDPSVRPRRPTNCQNANISGCSSDDMAGFKIIEKKF